MKNNLVQSNFLVSQTDFRSPDDMSGGPRAHRSPDDMSGGPRAHRSPDDGVGGPR